MGGGYQEARNYILMCHFQTFDDKKYLEAARGCAEVVWARGLLRKGYGICHGVAGNAYTFLTVYRLTGEEKYLHRACKVSRVRGRARSVGSGCARSVG